MSTYKFIDLFCGCGGLSKGFTLAGFESVGGIDFNTAAIKTFNEKYEESPETATDWYYHISRKSDYIREYRIKNDNSPVVVPYTFWQKTVSNEIDLNDITASKIALHAALLLGAVAQ